MTQERPYLTSTDWGLALKWEGMELIADFGALLQRTSPGRLGSELLVKAAKHDKLFRGKELTALDATAGLGEDSFLLAAAGFRVSMYERDPMIFALLEDALRRAGSDPDTAPIASRMTAVPGDSIEYMKKLAEGISDAEGPPDIIYLDPMFPARKKSGLIKKKFQILQQLEAPETDGEALIKAAIDASPRRIIVKRPAKAPGLGGVRADYSIKGDVIRYDCIILRP